MKNNKLAKILIPIIAVIVVIESIILVSNLDKSNTGGVANQSSQLSPVLEKEVDNPVVDFVFATDTKEMKVGKSYEVVLNLVAKKDFNLDGLEAYINYDSQLLTVSKLAQGTALPKADKLENMSGMVKSIFFIETPKEGYAVKTGEIVKVLSFEVTPKAVGVSTLELGTGNEGKQFVTMVVENTTSKQLPFSGNKLEINATK
ncbi:MAG TPA: hypothetical protein PKZ29_01250 [Candidatus Woesebacteria bacterium]|nr:hypothetical protein [Candidatus Woesebacteria bacterium]